jgi:hypothetical protein
MKGMVAYFRKWFGITRRRERGLVLFENVNEVIQAEKLLKRDGYQNIRVVAPPPQYRTGCDLCLEFPIVDQVGLVRTLKENRIPPLDCVHTAEETMKPVEICKTKDFGAYVMVRAANMKLTFEKQSQRIVNISGGGCSDVPYLAQEMIGKRLSEAPSPRDTGYTLCAYSLAIAFEEAKRRAGRI